MDRSFKNLFARAIALLLIFSVVFVQIPLEGGISYASSESPIFEMENDEYNYVSIYDWADVDLLCTEYNGEGMEPTVAVAVYGMSTPLNESGSPIESESVGFYVRFDNILDDETGKNTPNFELSNGDFVNKTNTSSYTTDASNIDNVGNAIPIDFNTENKITLSYQDKNGSANITFNWKPEGISLYPKYTNLLYGGELQFEVEGRKGSGGSNVYSIPNESIVWTSSNSSLPINNGLLTADSYGTTVISAIYDGMTCTTSVFVPTPDITTNADLYEGNVSAIIALFDVAGSGEVIVDGVSYLVDGLGNKIGEEVPFVVSLDEQFDSLNDVTYFSVDSFFIDKNDATGYASDSGDLSTNPSNGIPVDLSGKNKIVLTHESGINSEFYWRPSETSNIWSYVIREDHSFSENPEIDITINMFNGDLNNLHLELLAEDNGQKVATLDYFTTVVENINEITARFVYTGSEYDFSDPNLNNKIFIPKLIYDDNNDGIPEKTETLINIRLDNEVPDLFGWIDREETYNDIECYVVRVGFNDFVTESAVDLNNFEIRENPDISGINPIYIEGVGDAPLNEYYKVDLYFNKDNFIGDKLFIYEIIDSVGHRIFNSFTTIDEHETAVTGNVLDENGNIITGLIDGWINILPADLNLSEIQANNDYIHYYEDSFHIASDGSFDEYLEPGLYEIISLNLDYGTEERHVSMNQIIEVPNISESDNFILDIQIPKANLIGKVHKYPEETSSGTIIIMQDKYLEYFNDPSFGYQVEDAYGKKVETDENGSFSTYLSPGNYTVLGRREGGFLVEPIESYSFEVTNEATDSNPLILESTSGEIFFPEPNACGNAIDYNGLPVSNFEIRVYNQDTKKYSYVFGDDSGNFIASLEDGNYTLEYLKKSTYPDNGGKYFLNISFQIENGELILGSDGTNPLENLQLPLPNVEIRIHKDQEIFTSFEGSYGLVGKEVHMNIQDLNSEKPLPVSTETKTGILEFYLPNGSYALEKMFITDLETFIFFDSVNVGRILTVDENTTLTGDNAYSLEITELESQECSNLYLKNNGQAVTSISEDISKGTISLTAWAESTSISEDIDVTTIAEWLVTKGEDVVSVNNGVVTLKDTGSATITIVYDGVVSYLDIEITKEAVAPTPTPSVPTNNDTSKQQEEEEQDEAIEEENTDRDMEDNSVEIGTTRGEIEEKELEDGTKISIINLNEDETINAINELQGNRLTLDLDEGISNVAVSLTANSINALKSNSKESAVVIKSELAEYELPTAVIDLENLKEELGTDDININVIIKQPSMKTVEKMKKNAKEGKLEIISEPIEFKIEATAGDKKVEINEFKTNYVVRKIPLSNDVDLDTAVGVVYDEATGTYVHAPTKFVIDENGNLVAHIKRKGNSLYTVISNKKTFDDIKNNWAKENIELLASKLIINGINENEFAPDNDITRAEFAALLVRALGLNTQKVVENKFNDISEETWYYNAVNIAAEEGIVTGYGDGLSKIFRPNDTITREEMAAMIVRALRVADKEKDIDELDMYTILNKLSDKDDLGEWSQKSISIAIREGIITGRTSDIFAPKENATRAEAATVIIRMLRLVDFMN